MLSVVHNTLLKTWDTASLFDGILVPSQEYEESRRISSDIFTPDGQVTLELAFQAGSVDIPLQFKPDLVLVAGHSYEVRLICKGSVPGKLKFTDGGNSVDEVHIAKSWQEFIFVFTASNLKPAIPCLLLESHSESSRFYLGSVTLREREELGPIAPDWRLFLNITPPDSFDSIPDELSGPNGSVPVQTVSLKDGTLNLAELVEGFQERSCAVLYKSFESPTGHIVPWRFCGLVDGALLQWRIDLQHVSSRE